MFSWIRKKVSAPADVAAAPSLSAINWPTDAYASVRFLVGMYVTKGAPFSQWKAPRALLSPAALSTAELCVQGWQLSVWFHLFEHRFDPVAAKMAKDAALAMAKDLSPDDDFSDMLWALLQMYTTAEGAYADMPAQQRQVTINGQTMETPWPYFLSLYFFARLDGSPYKGQDSVPESDTLGLAQCVEDATTTAKAVFAPMLAAVADFDPASFTSWRWSEKPGAHEMHLMRRQNNPLFSPERRHVTGAEVYAARVRDAELWRAVAGEAGAIRKELDETESSANWEDFLYDMREKVDALMERAHRLGSTAPDVEEYLETCRSFITDVWMGAHKNNPEKLALYAKAEQLHHQKQAVVYATEWLRQVGNPEGVIPPQEVVAALLSEGLEQVQATVRVLEHDEDLRSMLLQLRTSSLDIVKPLLAAGHQLPDIREMLEALGVAV
jgi:hypothetical protein